MGNLTELEKQGWQALSDEQETARNFYRSVLTDDAVMVFPGGIVLRGKDKILDSIVAQPWNSFQLEDTQEFYLTENAGVVIYKVSARREGSATYIAFISSLYILREGQWKLALHQQTPV